MNFKKSVRFKTVSGFILVVAPLVFFLFYNNMYAMNVVRDQVSLNYSKLLTHYVNGTDDMLKEFDYYFYRLESDPEIVSMQTNKSSIDDYVLAKQKVYNKFITDIGYYSMINTFFVYSSSNDDLLVITQESGNFHERYQTIQNYLSQILGQTVPHQGNEWQLIQSGDPYFLVQMKDLGSEMYAGCLISLNNLAMPLSTWDVGEGGGTIIVTDDGQPLTGQFLPIQTYAGFKKQLQPANQVYQIIRDETNKKEYLVVGESSKLAKIHYLIVVAEKKILQNLPYLHKAIYFLPLGVALVLALYLAFLQKIFFKPMGQLIRGMRKIGRGQFDVRLNESNSTEFAFLVSTFNDMVKQIEHLKISIYEEKIRVQQAEFKHLQMQINPHFYMNCLNIIYNLAALKDHKSVQKMALHLADYFRNLIRTDRTSVSLMDEIQHICNYLEIQVMRYPDSLTFAIHIEESYRDYQLPSLTLQPFVENAVIHGYIKNSERFCVEIKAFPDPEDPQHFFIVTISDNGKGFTPEMLRELRSDHYAKQSGDGHLGIWNVLRRLRMSYGTAKIHFSNREQTGAEIRIRFPLQHHFGQGDGSSV
ncbi:HAMP domain-containing protein [Paenibacillus sp. SYP-B3998]|uniref:HAMP domain-containing protein n=1 Tax=Paenibacillus sp. SYP-B3998 TaxID=2678564 RepID=A0A6G4A4Y2_9BACL|nr:histidine kinase [Paenibacillus sp. SYP-B3998]NEW09348.1 HAMP domain-containing protein [Paenibacillus sp. SYP-B3998]